MAEKVAPISYFLRFCDFDGSTILDIYDWMSVEFTYSEGKQGYLYIDIPDIYPRGLFKKDGIFEIYRKIGEGEYYLEGNNSWFVRLGRYKTDENGREFIHLICYNAINILNRRIVAYASESDEAKQTLPADDLIKRIVTQNFISATDTTRNIEELSVDPDFSLAPSITKEFAYRKVLPLIQEICDETKLAGTYLTFDVLNNGSGTVILKTYVGSRGTDRGSNSSSPLYFSLERGNLSYATVERDFTEEMNFIYAGGRGEDVNRVIATAYDEHSMNFSPMGRVEDWIDIRDVSNPDAAESEANARLQEAKYKLAINTHIQQTPECLYGLHYHFGDIVAVEYKGFTIDVHVDTISIKLDENSRETITILGRNLEDTEF